MVMVCCVLLSVVRQLYFAGVAVCREIVGFCSLFVVRCGLCCFLVVAYCLVFVLCC